MTERPTNAADVSASWRMLAGFNSLPDAGDLVGGQIVHDDDVAWTQNWRQHLFDPGEEALSVHRTVPEASVQRSL